MEVYVEKVPAYVTAVKAVFAIAGPAQRLIQSSSMTHTLCNRQAQKILFNDGHHKYAAIVDELIDYLDRGVSWADEGFRNMAHFFNPCSGRGLFGWTDAVTECGGYWNQAVRNWRSGKHEKSFFYLGAAIHLVQDMCVPHHAMGIIFDGHQEYEDWVSEKRDSYLIESEGIYGLGNYPVDWLKSNAVIALLYYHLVRAGSIEQNYHKATSVLFPRAQAVSAGFIHYFLEIVI